MDGNIVGGWEFVWAAYGVTWVSLLLYAVSLGLRVRAAARAPTGKEDAS